MAPFDTLMQLDEIIRDLNRAQRLVDQVRWENPTDGHIQLSLDREQARLDRQRENISNIMETIAASN